MNFLKRLFDQDYRELKKFSVIADKIEELEEEYSKLSDYELKAKTDEFKNRLENGETLDDILVEAYATAREAAFRVNNEKPFYVQLLGAIAIHKGNIAEMKTGEGKTLTSVLPAYLNALDGKGTHIVTVNEYLADRDAKWMGRIHEFLGLSVGINLRDLTPQEKKKAYECDILYTTNNELGFDYLRDNMVTHKEDRVQRKLNFAIVDEVDSVLIDEARTPLIISGGDLKNVSMYEAADRFAKKLKKDVDYIYEEQNKTVTLTEEGVKKGEKEFHLANLYEVSNANLIHHINQALRANFSMRKDVDYVVNNGEIVIVDQFTGRLMKGRAYSDGLHQAIEAKENVKINQETKTLATITFQNLFRMYNKLSGMTGTAKTEEEEFNDIYNMRVICIPTNKPVARIDAPDLLYPTQKGKFTSLINEVEKRHKLGQPILIGTIAVETNELISQLLTSKNIEHEVLNAKNNAREAEIIAKAGQKGAVTVATNMAGRGTDIKLTDETKDLGGLCVLGTERHESRRIDNQLRGRSGRQGDPGFSQFYVSMEDDLMVRFGTDGLKNMLIRLGFEETEAITSKRFTKGLSSAQKRVEGNNFDIRKNLLQYDDVMNNQREIMYAKRNEILDSESIHDSILVAVENHVTDVVKSKLIDSEKLTKEDLQEIVEYFNTLLREDIKFDEIASMDSDAIIYFVKEKILSEVVEEFEKVITLSVVDKYWTEHINSMEHFREAIYLRGYGQQDPLRAYTVEGFDLFNKMLQNIDQEITLFLVKSEISQNQERQEISKSKMTNDGKVKLKNKPKKIEKVGRNDMCPCGSGKKYKQCCGK